MDTSLIRLIWRSIMRWPWDGNRQEASGHYKSLRESESDYIKSGIADFSDIIGEIYNRANEKYGTDVQPEVTK